MNFTEESNRGFAYAAEMASGLGAGLTALHVRLDPIWGAHPERKIRRLLDALPGGSRPVCRTLVETDQTDAAEGILKAGGNQDLIVMAARENSRLKDMLLGTTGERVLRAATVSVLIVPAARRPSSGKSLSPLSGAALG